MAVDGTYKITVDSPMGKQESKLIFKTDGEKLSGVMEASMVKADFTGTVKGNDVSWSVEISSPIGKTKLEFKGKVTGPGIRGDVKIGFFGSYPFIGKKAQ